MVQLLEEMEKYAQVHRVPIMEVDGLAFLLKQIEEHQVKVILEIGTAIGYSAIRMCLVDPEIKVVTLERDLERYEEACKNVKAANLEERITILFGDALELTVEGTYDLIFIDAAKSQYTKFFEKYRSQLNPHGLIVSDNLGFHGLVAHPEQITSKNVRSMVRKINEYRTFLEENPDFQTKFYEIGDGIGVSQLIA